MSNTTQGRRPDGPGWYWYSGPWSNGHLTADEPVRVFTWGDPDEDAPRLWAAGVMMGEHTVDSLPGTFTPLTKPVAMSDSDGAAMPAPDWSQAPPWANWWAVEHAYGSLGMAYWFGGEPVIQYSEWVDFPGTKALYNPVDLPLGVDWRTTLRKRPEVSGE